MKRAPILTALLLAAMVSVVRAFPQQKSTYEQTHNWIVSKISEEAGFTHSDPDPSSGYHTISYENVSMDGCKLQFTVSLYYSVLRHTTVDVVSIPLDKVKSVSVDHFGDEKDSYSAMIHSSPKAVSVKETTKSNNGSIEGQEVHNLDGFAIVFGRPKAENETMAGRMQKALSRAVQLCAASPSKEPF